jgi:UbiD family decarboxylase
MSRICLALGVKHLDELAKEIEELTTPPMPRGFMDALKMMPLVSRLTDLMPKTVKDAPCQEIVRENGGLDELPIPTTWPEDGGPFITLPLVITRDPETGMRNIGTYRMQVYDRRPRHALAAAQGRRAALSRGRADGQAARSRRWLWAPIRFCSTRPPRRCLKASMN